MSFIPVKLSEWKLRFFKKTASTAFSNKSVVDWPASQTGFFVPGDATTTKFLGLLQIVVASGDEDYADNTLEPVLVPRTPDAEVYATSAGTAVATDVGLRCDLTDSVSINESASSVGRFVITGFKDTATYIGYFIPVVQTGAT